METQATPTATVTDCTNIAAAAASTPVVYEVFLSFCGKDTRKGFTDFLYTYLVGASVLTFRDDNELRVGENISSELKKAISESKISIPIFSKKYASSKWCLLELEQMVECHKQGGQMIYPIFYDVDPSDVRNQRGVYTKGFRLHKKKFDEGTVHRWREALRMVGELKGLELKKETNGREGELVKKVVEKVLLELKKNYTHVPKNLVGMDNHIETLMGLLKFDSNSLRIVGIHGMGGLGKTTIAKVLYNQFCEHFEGHCFLDNVRENSAPVNRIVNLQKQLISKIQHREVPEFNDYHEGSKKIKDAVRGRKVLVVLDDVDKSFQVDMLMGHQSWFSSLSRIIITTRDTDVLDAIEMSCKTEGLDNVYASYKPDFMDNYNSLQLFSKYAFMRDSPMDEFKILSEEVVEIAAGLPLVLQVLGSTFFVAKDKDSWEDKLEKLRVIPHNEVLEKLKFSFEALDYTQQQIFLDIACFFVGSDIRRPSYMWEDCKFYPREGIRVLVSRSLITIGDDNDLIVHDQLRDLGRQIVRTEGLIEPGKQSRFWIEEEAMQILETRQGTSNINALCLPSERSEGSEDQTSSLVASDFHDLPNIRYLNLGYHDMEGDFKHRLSNLRWLEWINHTVEFTPTNLLLKNLVVLILSFSEFPEEWWSQFKMAKKLKLLDLTGTSIEVIPGLSRFASLEVLILEQSSICKHDGLGQLKSLKYLDVSCCDNLEKLPSLSNLTKLVELHLKFTDITEIQGLEELVSLEVLDIVYCDSLERLPNVSNLIKLKSLNAMSCSNLMEVEGLHRLNNLEYLELSSCSSLRSVPDLSNLIKLEYLNLSSCSSLRSVPDLSNLKELIVLCAPGFYINEILPDFSNSKNIIKLQISFCDDLIMLQDLDTLESLQNLNIVGGSIKTLPDLSNLKRLKFLSITYCNELVEFQDQGELASLEHLDMSSCTSIERLPSFSNSTKLRELRLSDCTKLIGIQDLDKMEFLEVLHIGGCPSFERLTNLPNFGMLNEIEVMSCNNLREVEGVGVIESLESLVISGCEELHEVPDLRSLKNLKKLCFSFLKELTAIYGLEELTSLESLDIKGCKLIEALPDFSKLVKLTELDASYCVNLTEIRGLEDLKSLEKLIIIGCERLRDPKNLPNTMIQRHREFEYEEVAIAGSEWSGEATAASECSEEIRSERSREATAGSEWSAEATAASEVQRKSEVIDHEKQQLEVRVQKKQKNNPSSELSE